MFPSLLQPLMPNAHVLAGLYCQGTSHFQQAESHFARAAALFHQQAEQSGAVSAQHHQRQQQQQQQQGGFQMRDGPQMSARVLQACAILSQVSSLRRCCRTMSWRTAGERFGPSVEVLRDLHLP